MACHFHLNGMTTSHFARKPWPLLAVCLALQPFAVAHAQDTESVQSAAESPRAWAVGAGWWRYSEPKMTLEGPQLTLYGRYELLKTGWPDRLEAELGAASLRYSSRDSGSLSHVPMLRGQASALWRLESSGQWRAGLQVEATWVDLRGTTSSGYAGYERLNSKAWAVLQYEHPSTASTEAGLLLRGRQQSWLSQAHPGLPDITNTQKRGVYLAYRHSPWQNAEGTGLSLRPLIRYTHVSDSDQVGADRWYEPHNQTWQIGLEGRW